MYLGLLGINNVLEIINRLIYGYQEIPYKNRGIL